MPLLRKVVLDKVPAVAIVGETENRKKSYSAPQHLDYGNLPRHTVSRKIKTTGKVTVPAKTQVRLPVRTETGGLCIVQNHPKMVHKHLSLMANEVMDVLPHQPFSVLFSNFGDKPVTVPKNAVVGLDLPAPKEILTIYVNAIRAEAAGNVSRPQEDKSKSSPADREEKPDSDWRDKVNIGVKDRLVRYRIVSLLEDFQELWNGELRQIKATQHRIELTPGAKPVH